MRKIKILTCLLAVWVLFSLNQIFAQEKLSLSGWKVNKSTSGKSSEINSNDILLRQYSSVFTEGISFEISSVIMICKWLTPLDYVEMPITLTLYYQDGTFEHIQQKIPKGIATEQKLNFSPKTNIGKKIVKMQILHGSTAMEVRVYSIEIVLASNCFERIKLLNSDFNKLIDEMKKTGKVDEIFIKKLENVLMEYKNIK